MAQLIDLDTAKRQIPNPSECDDNLISFLIEAASDTVETYCRRKFTKANYDELHTVMGRTCSIFVENPPISNVSSVRAGQLPALQVQYNDSGNQTQEANITVNATGVYLRVIYNNVTTPHDFTFASYPTFEVLADAINALGSNWVATKNYQFNKWQVADSVIQGSWNARNYSVQLNVYWNGQPYFRQNDELGELYNGSGWVKGYQAYRIQYTGGFDPIPAAIQSAVAELVKVAYLYIQINPNLISETLDKYSYTRNTTLMGIDQLSLMSKLALNQYKILTVAKWK